MYIYIYRIHVYSISVSYCVSMFHIIKGWNGKMCMLCLNQKSGLGLGESNRVRVNRLAT